MIRKTTAFCWRMHLIGNDTESMHSLIIGVIEFLTRGRFSQNEVDELKSAFQWPLVRQIAMGFIGDAARRDLLSPEQVNAFMQLVPAEAYAGRQLRARSVLFNTTSPNETSIESLLSLRAAWALEELVGSTSVESELQTLERCLHDARLYRSHRESFRNAIRRRQNDISQRA